MKAIPRIKAVMTPFPHSLEPGDPLEKARRVMVEGRFRHLPVMVEGRPVGVITDDQVRRAIAAAGSGESPRVGDLTRAEAYVVDLSTPLDVVLQEMARRHRDAALVVRAGRLVGIFTVTDACRAFAELLRREFPPPGGHEAA